MTYRFSYFNLDAYNIECYNHTITQILSKKLPNRDGQSLFKFSVENYKYRSRTAVSASLSVFSFHS